MGMVAFLLGIMGWYMIAGLPDTNSGLGDLTPSLQAGRADLSLLSALFLLATGLTKVASIAEEVEDPSKNIPLGVIVSLFVSTVVYTVGVLVAVAVVPADDLIVDAPLHTAAEYFILPSAQDLLSQP